MLVVVDYGMGNIASVRNALDFLKVRYLVSRDSSTISEATKLLLPGVGSFRKAMSNLHEYRLYDVLKKKVESDSTPLLGICLGMQLLASSGSEDADEANPTPGFGWIPGEVVRIRPTTQLCRVPHMGFNGIQTKNSSALLSGIPEDSHFYFVHSFHFRTTQGYVAASTDYHQELVAIVQKEHIFGVQFHPEKSQQVGLKLLQNFVEL